MGWFNRHSRLRSIEIPGVNSQEATRRELIENLRSALEETLEMNRADGRATAEGAYEDVSITA